MIKKSAQIADQIGEALIEMGWPLGQTVRTESELMAEYETSRAVVREALSLVEHRGIANVKTGRGGGLHVAYTRKEAAVNELSAYMELADCQRDDLVLMTGAMHAKVAEVALRECSDETASRLEALRAMFALPASDLAESIESFDQFWIELAQLTGNTYFSLLISACQKTLRSIIYFEPRDVASAMEHADRSRAHKLKIIDAMLSWNWPLTSSLIDHDVQQRLEALKRTRLLAPEQHTNPDISRLKLSHLTALKLARDITENELEKGHRIGSEEELLKRFGVSRPVLREALRTLEAYSIVKMKSGRGGGLSVGQPDPSHTFDWVLKYLNTLPTRMHYHLDFRIALEVQAAEQAAKRVGRNETDVAGLYERIEAAQSHISSPHTEAATATTARIPVEIARVAGNTVQTFFTGLALANVVSVFRFKSSQEITRVINSYRLVIDAIAAGDEGRARRQTYQHLRDNYAPYLQVRSEDQIKLKLAQSA